MILQVPELFRKHPRHFSMFHKELPRRVLSYLKGGYDRHGAELGAGARREGRARLMFQNRETELAKGFIG